jgi:hypothetical protein
MGLQLGSLLLVKPGTHVPPGSRYSSGIITNIRDVTPHRWLTILWADGHQSTEYLSKVKPYYEFIKP